MKDTIRHLESELHKCEIMKQQSGQRIKELEDRIEKFEESKTKLQNRWFHDERNYSTQIRNLEEVISFFPVQPPFVLFVLDSCQAQGFECFV